MFIIFLIRCRMFPLRSYAWAYICVECATASHNLSLNCDVWKMIILPSVISAVYFGCYLDLVCLHCDHKLEYLLLNISSRVNIGSGSGLGSVWRQPVTATNAYCQFNRWVQNSDTFKWSANVFFDKIWKVRLAQMRFCFEGLWAIIWGTIVLLK